MLMVMVDVLQEMEHVSREYWCKAFTAVPQNRQSPTETRKENNLFCTRCFDQSFQKVAQNIEKLTIHSRALITQFGVPEDTDAATSSDTDAATSSDEDEAENETSPPKRRRSET